MSKHWPPNKVVRTDFWTPRRRPPQKKAWLPLALLGGAALAGAAVGGAEALMTRGSSAAAEPAIEWNAVQAVPTRDLAADDRAWEQRAVEQPPVEQPAVESASGASSRAGAIRASFGFCHTGGGTNCVVDGDTIWLGGQRIRVADIDAPETHPPRCAQEAELGNRATQRLRQLLNSGAISLQSIDRDEDKYGRKLRVVLVDGSSVGDTLVGEGLARYYGSGRRSWC